MPVLNSLAGFLALAVMKDIICNIWINELIRDEIRQSAPNMEEINRLKEKLNASESTALLHSKTNADVITVYRKSVVLFYSVILEDGIQLFLQYFYFEKYMTQIENFIIFNAVVKFLMIFRFAIFIGKVDYSPVSQKSIKSSKNCRKTGRSRRNWFKNPKSRRLKSPTVDLQGTGLETPLKLSFSSKLIKVYHFIASNGL